MRDTGGSAPGAAYLLSPSTPDGLRVFENRHNLVVLRDFTIHLNGSTVTEKTVEFYNKLYAKTSYDQSSSSAADITTNGLFLFIIEDEIFEESTLAINARLTFTDA